ETVHLGPLFVLRTFPFGGYPLLPFQAMQGGVKRPGLHLQDVARVRANHLADPVAMLRSPHQGLQNQQVQSALEQFDTVLISGSRHVDTLPPMDVDGLLGASLADGRIYRGESSPSQKPTNVEAQLATTSAGTDRLQWKLSKKGGGCTRLR